MHTYRKAGDHWQAGYQHPDEPRFNPLGPAFVDECWAAAYASYLNGGRFSPGEIEHIFGIDRSPDVNEDEDNDVHPARPKSLEDYPIERRKA